MRSHAGAVKHAFAWIYAPAFFCGFVLIAVQIVGSGSSGLWLPLVVLAAVAVSFAAERLVPYEPSWNDSRGDLARDAAHALVNETATLTAVASIPLLLGLAPGIHMWPVNWPLVVQLGLAVVVADLGITLAHVASHRSDVLWRLHAVHHSVERMYGFNGLMKHPLHQAIEMIAGTAPLVLVGMPVDVGALLGVTVAIQLLLQHSNVDMRVGWPGRIWAVAPAHRHHHLASETEGDVNFGLFFTVWDRLLGTFVDRPSPRAGELGIAGRPKFPSSYAAQLVEPFRRWPRPTRHEQLRGGGEQECTDEHDLQHRA